MNKKALIFALVSLALIISACTPKSSAWLNQPEPIKLVGLTLRPDIDGFVSPSGHNHTITTQADQVAYCQTQFNLPQKVVHMVYVEIRPDHTVTVPQGMEGQCWIWDADLTVGEQSFQQYVLWYTNNMLVNRPDISLDNVTLLVCGDLPKLDKSLTQLTVGTTTLKWQSQLDGWDCR